MAGLKRVHYVSGQLLSAEDFRAEQEYLRERAKRHNRVVHGAGVVSGLAVSLPAGQTLPSVSVAPGLAIDAAGNEIELREPASLVLPAAGAGRLAVSVRYTERLADHVPGADGLVATRIEEGAEVVLTPLAKGVRTVPPEAGVLLTTLRRTTDGWLVIRTRR